MYKIFLVQLGLTLQMRGFWMNLEIIGATVFVDHYSDHVYVYLMHNLTLDKTLLAKDTHKEFLHSIGVTAKLYTLKDLVLLESSITESHDNFYISDIKKLVFHFTHVSILGTHRCGKERIG